MTGETERQEATSEDDRFVCAERGCARRFCRDELTAKGYPPRHYGPGESYDACPGMQKRPMKVDISDQTGISLGVHADSPAPVAGAQAA